MVSEMSAKTFTVELERVEKTATMFRVPFDLGDAFGRARPPVKVTIRGHKVAVPADLRAALDDDPAVVSAFDTLSFTPQREYVEWVDEAKRPETRARRIAPTVERVAAGTAPP
jgi:Bacteriocin-protection, YdeI or OmpD-Associated/Domain of unknown function (DUF1905)